MPSPTQPKSAKVKLRWITFVAGLPLLGQCAFCAGGTMNGPMFLAYVQQCLVLTLKRGAIVTINNLPVHRVVRVEVAIAAVGATLVYLPTYSLDLNPIELAFQLKAHLPNT